ncbi:hypothetical protein [Streptomyces fractus]|uniref:hypothetical protein n=1 Tax=Streptomyces fractus TaxID=641806 RepID=UPI003CEAC899
MSVAAVVRVRRAMAHLAQGERPEAWIAPRPEAAGTTAVYVSRGAEHQGPPGGGVTLGHRATAPSAEPAP